MTEAQHYRSPQLIRRTACCGGQAGVANGRTWCMVCGQQVLRPTDVLGMFKQGPGAATPSQQPVPAVTHDPAPTYEQGAML